MAAGIQSTKFCGRTNRRVIFTLQPAFMITVRPLEGIGMDRLHKAFLDAFSDYKVPMNLSLHQLTYMLERRGYDGALSFGAFNDDDLVGFVFNGVGDWNGVRTAYDTGTGVVREFRKQGIATLILDESLPVLKTHGVEQYLLEVIRTNTGAYDLYRKAGFEIVRELDVYLSPIDQVRIDSSRLSDRFTIRELTEPDWELFQTFWEFEPSWQNSIASLMRKYKSFRFLAVYTDTELGGYGIMEPATGDIPQFAVAKQYRRQGIGSALFHRLIQLSETGTIKIINAAADYLPFKQFALSLGLSPGAGQYEMIQKL
jgi:ribosomal protein S18 acetylase RimI-like enzyme